MANIKDRIGGISNKSYHEACANRIQAEKPEYILTLQWNYPVTKWQALEDIKKLHRNIDRVIFGTRFNTGKIRTEAEFYFEGEEKLNLHCHSTWKISEENISKFEELFSGGKDNNVWNNIVRSGCFDLQSDFNLEAASKYITKQQHKNSETWRWTISREFHN